MNAQFKNFLSFFLRLIFSGGVLFYIFTKIDMEKTVEVLKTADLSLMAAAFVIFFMINMILLWRWMVYIRGLELNASFLTAMRYFFIGLFGNLFLPTAVGGDLIKVWGLCRDSAQKPRVVASVLIDRLSGFAGIMIVGTLAYLFGYQLIKDGSLMFSVAVLAVLSIGVGIVLFNHTVYSFFCKVFNPFPKIREAVMAMHYDLALLKGKGKQIVLLRGVALSCLAQVVSAGMSYLIARALHQEIPLIYFLIFIPLMCVASTVPSIGGLGAREAGAAYLFSKVGVGAGIAVSISLITFLFMMVIGLMGGLIYVATLSAGRVQHYPSGPGLGNANV